MDPTTLPRPSPEKYPPSPPYPPQNPHTPTEAVIEASPCPFDCYQKAEPTTSRSMDNFKALMLKLAGRLLPAHQSLIERRFDDIIPDEFLVPDHPPYADMILTALWELKSEGGSSEEAISDFIEKEYHDLPWAHTTILNHHLKDLCMKGRITMKHDKCYLLCSSITKSIPNLSPSPTPPSTPDSSSSASICSSPTSSSSSLCWDHPYQTQKRKRKRKRMRKHIRGRGRGRPPIMIRVGKQGSSRGTNLATKQGVYSKEFKIGEESQVEDQNEVTVMEADGVTARIVEEENLPCEQHKVGDEEQHQPQKLYNVTWIGRGVRKLSEAEREFLNRLSDNDVELADDVSDDEKEQENKQSDTVEKQISGEEEPMSVADDKILLFEAQVDVGSVGKQHDNAAEEEIQPKMDDKEEFQTHEQQKGGTEQKILEKAEAEEQNEFLNENQESREQFEDQHDDVTDKPIHQTNDSLQFCGQDQLKNVEAELAEDQQESIEQSEEQHDDVTDKPIHQTNDSLRSCGQDQLKHVEAESAENRQDSKEQSEEQHDDVTDKPIHQTNDSLPSCGQDQLKNIEAKPAEDQPQQEEHQTEVCQKETVLGAGTDVQQECVEMIEEQKQPCIQQTEISEKELLQEENNAPSNENSASSGSLDHKQQDEQRQPLRQKLRSSSKKVDTTPKAKKQIEEVTPVCRILRSHKTASEAAVITEVPDRSKERLKHSGRATPSKRKPKIAEAEQVSNVRRTTRRTGL